MSAQAGISPAESVVPGVCGQIEEIDTVLWSGDPEGLDVALGPM